MAEDEKFIMMGLDDENSKLVSEVMGSKSAKKILNFLGDNNEASEKDIADALSMKLNTVEYNLQKLVKAGFVKKSKNFFWSSKGKKIAMYTLAHKHMIIGTKKPTLSLLKKSLFPALAVIAILILIAGMWGGSGPQIISSDFDPAASYADASKKQFDSEESLLKFIKKSQNQNDGGFGGFGGVLRGGPVAMEASLASDSAASIKSADSTQESASSSGDFSTTNVQVEGVDEADIVKTDGEYIYALVQNKIVIVRAADLEIVATIEPASTRGYSEDSSASGGTSEASDSDSSEEKIAADLAIYYPGEFEQTENFREIFIYEDKLIVLYNANEYVPYTGVRCLGREHCGGEYVSWSGVKVFDTSNKTNPEKVHEVTYDGNYVNSRMINEHVYVITNNYLYSDEPGVPIYARDGVEASVAIEDIYYFGDSGPSLHFTTVSAVNVNTFDFETESYLVGDSSSVYMSENNLYISGTRYKDYGEYEKELVREAILPLLSDNFKKDVEKILDSEKYSVLDRVGEITEDYYNSLETKEAKEEFEKELAKSIDSYRREFEKEWSKTVIQKISVDETMINHEATGEVPGTIHNQFSLDEFDGNLRITTTTGSFWFFGRDRSPTLNHVYVLDEDLDIIGSVSDLAEGESIFSSRFVGDRLYLVTFEQIDPLFVIDLSNPKDPKVLGELKITGVSDYLHPYDENHIIGIGRDGDEEGRIGGMKISLFDVSDVTNPKEKANYIIGERGTYSDALHDHRAVLFNKEKNLLVLPVTVVTNNYRDHASGAHVFYIDEFQVSFRGVVTHEKEENKENERYYSYNDAIQRSLFIENTLYTLSNKAVASHNLKTLQETNFLKFPFTQDEGYPVFFGEPEILR